MEKKLEDNDTVARNIKLRNYQINLIERAKRQNSVLFLPAGSGKTLIAIHVLCSRTTEIEGEFPHRGKRAFFVAPTRVLVAQICKTLSVHTKFKVKYFFGDKAIDSWNKKNWQDQFKNYQVIVLTGEILKQILELQCILPSQISLIVFDECHHANSQHPYSLILQHINREPLESSPLILGLSAVLLNANPKQKEVQNVINNINRSFRGTILTTAQHETSSFAAKPKEVFVPYEWSPTLMEEFLPFYDEIIYYLGEVALLPSNLQVVPETSRVYKNPDRARKFRNWFVNAKEILQECGIYCGALAALYYIILVEKVRLMSNNKMELNVLVYCRTSLYKIRKILLSAMGEATYANIYKYSTDKIQTFLSLLLDINQRNEERDLCMLVFVQRKVAAVAIATLLKVLKNTSDKFSFLKPEFIFGSNVFDKDSLMHELSNEQIVKEFSSQNLNILVSTSILEEGIDLRMCKEVISFDFPKSYSSYFQTKGRVRNKDGTYYVFVNEMELDKKKSVLNDYRQVEDELYKAISKNTIGRDNWQMYLGQEDDDCELTSSAIIAVYRYCGMLPQDKYSFLSPMAWYTDFEGKKKASVQLPINCPIQEVVEGDLFPNAKLAKRSVFIKVLNMLKELGEIDENCNPASFGVKMQCFDHLFPHFRNETVEKDAPLPGTKKRKQLYEMKFAESLSECLPRQGEKAYLHIINFDFQFEEAEREEKIKLQEVLQCPVTFAMLSTKKLFKICQFQMYLDVALVNCNLLINYDEVVLSETELEDIKLCHFAVFKKVLNVGKSFHIFDNRNKNHSFYLVPVSMNEFGRFAIDWDVIRSDFCRVNQLAIVTYNPTYGRYVRNKTEVANSRESVQVSSALVPLSDIESQNLYLMRAAYSEPNQRHQFVISETAYKNFVLYPSYRNFNSQIYIVCKVCHNLTPLSPFPNSLYPDYYSYYQDKYMLEVSNVNQPLIKVAPIFNCSNFNKPKLIEKQKKKGSHKTYEEIFIPELCHIIPFDRRYWIKALLLPSVINRLYNLYRIEEFRRKLIKEINLGVAELPTDAECQLLRADTTLEKDESERDGDSDSLSLDMFLPLSQLKLENKRNSAFYKEIKRNILDIGVCDLEYMVSFFKYSESELEEGHYLLDSVIAEVDFKNSEDVLVPSLELLKRKENKTGPDLPLLVQFIQGFPKLRARVAWNASKVKDINLEIKAELKQPEELQELQLFCNLNSGELHAPLLETLGNLVVGLALTSSSACDGINYERLEILGDAFLKFAVSVFLFRNFDKNEGALTNLKSKLVGNRNLYYCGIARGFQNVLNNIDFSPMSDWNPPLLCLPEEFLNSIISSEADSGVIYDLEIPTEEGLSGNLSQKTLSKNMEIINRYGKTFNSKLNGFFNIKSITDKTIADSVEAVIGVYLLDFGLFGSFQTLKWLGVLPEDLGSYSKLIEKEFEPRIFPNCSLSSVMEILNEVFYKDLEDTLGYKFKNKALLLEAITHPTYLLNRVTDCYQRLEFLGDAILDFLITCYIYQYCGEKTPGEVTDIRSALVNNITFASLSVRYGFHKYMLKLSTRLNTAIEEFVSHQISNNHKIDDNVLIMLEENECALTEAVEVPKALGDIFESLAGAIFLDSGNSLETVWAIFYRLMKDEIASFTKKPPKDPVRLLFEICKNSPKFEMTIMDNGGVEVKLSVLYENTEIQVSAVGKNKKEAKRTAAKFAVTKISEFLLKNKNVCNAG